MCHAECLVQKQVLEWVEDLLQQPGLSCLLATIHTVSTHMPWTIPRSRTCGAY